MIKTCPHCEIEKEYKSHQQFGAHVSRCDKNPNLTATLKAVELAGMKRRVEKTSINLVCKCGVNFVQSITPAELKRNSYNKFCSRKCANSRGKRSEEVKQKVRLTFALNKSNCIISAYPYSYVYFYKCKNRRCCKSFASKYRCKNYQAGVTQRYCSMSCKNTCKDLRKKLSDNIRERYDKNPEMHPNRRCNKIKETYPEKYLREYLENNNIIFEKQFRVKRYFIDFYIPKLNLCLEVDGERWHDRTSEREIKRENIIKEKHNLVRFWSKPLVKGEYQKDIQNIIKQYNKS